MMNTSVHVGHGARSAGGGVARGLRWRHGKTSPKRNVCASSNLHNTHLQHTPARHLPVHPEIGKVIFSEDVLAERVTVLGSLIGQDYKDKDLLVLGVLKGAFKFTADLVCHIYPYPPSLEIDFLRASSYGSGTVSSGSVKLDGGFDLASVAGKHVLLVEDIIDTGNTLSKLVELMRQAGAASVRVCALLDKRARRRVEIEADYVGFQCPDEFIVGYGIDYAEKYRQLPYIGVPKPEHIKL